MQAARLYRTAIPRLASWVLLTGFLTLALVVSACDSSGSRERGQERENEEEQVEQADFTVTVAQKTSAHPYSEQGFPQGYVVDGVQGKELTLERGQSYTFQMDGVPMEHPFYIALSEPGQGRGTYTDGVENNNASGDETLTFTLPDDAPHTLYYNCGRHAYMGGKINVVDSGE